MNSSWSEAAETKAAEEFLDYVFGGDGHVGGAVMAAAEECYTNEGLAAEDEIV